MPCIHFECTILETTMQVNHNNYTLFTSDYEIAHNNQLSSGYGRGVLFDVCINVYGTIANNHNSNHDNNQFAHMPSYQDPDPSPSRLLVMVSSSLVPVSVTLCPHKHTNRDMHTCIGAHAHILIQTYTYTRMYMYIYIHTSFVLFFLFPLVP